MKPLIAVCTLVTVYICITKGMSYDELRPHKAEMTECRRTRIQMKKVMCVPRPTMEKLIPQPGYTFYPNYALVNKCSGYCPGSKSCMPIRTQPKKIAVRVYGYNSTECYHVFLEEHTKCKCHCSVKESDCNVHQIYSENNCACECLNRIQCDEARQMVWDEETCKCICNKEEESCSTGLEWVSSRCRCAKVMEMNQLEQSNMDTDMDMAMAIDDIRLV